MGRLSTVDLLIKLASFVKKRKIYFSVIEAADLTLLVQVGEMY